MDKITSKTLHASENARINVDVKFCDEPIEKIEIARVARMSSLNRIFLPKKQVTDIDYHIDFSDREPSLTLEEISWFEIDGRGFILGPNTGFLINVSDDDVLIVAISEQSLKTVAVITSLQELQRNSLLATSIKDCFHCQELHLLQIHLFGGSGTNAIQALRLAKAQFQDLSAIYSIVKNGEKKEEQTYRVRSIEEHERQANCALVVKRHLK